AHGVRGGVEGDHAYILRRRQWFHQVNERLDGEPGPWHRHRPGFNTAVAVESLFQGHAADQIVDVNRSWLLDQSCDLDLPGPGLEGFDQTAHALLVRAELVEVVVASSHRFISERPIEDKTLVAFGGVQIDGRTGRG